MSEKWNSNVQFPTDSNFVNRITEASFGPSNSSGNPMITWKAEVVSPADVEIGDKTYNIAGVKTINYLVTEVKDGEGIDAFKTEACRERVSEFWKKLGLDPQSINWDNIDVKPLVNLKIYTQMEPEINERHKNPTAAQLAEGKAKGLKKIEGDIMKNPLTGKPIIQYFPKIREVFGIVPDGSVSY